MLSKITILLSVLYLFIGSPTLAQATTGRNIDDHLLIKDAQRALGAKEENIEGTPYLDDSFTQGEVYFAKGKPTVVPVRYNIYKDWVEYQQNNQTYILDPNERIKKIKLGERILIVESFESRGKTKQGYFILIDSGKVMLLSKKTVTYRERTEAKALEAGATPAKYTQGPDRFFFKVENGQVQSVENVKSVIAALPNNHDELNRFVKEEKISVRKEKDLVRLIKYYNSL
ncbi:hypothetical protein [Chryseolinea sp. H1M3-3]|uniref:hypothetical protein n=1 Tax=Chryseolinea sp. H1M3-3 TaxID=3034144 RepID=UPI0023EDB9D0|nr:hypothetical protein [Chryseolinea sp. H1M3-3]